MKAFSCGRIENVMVLYQMQDLVFFLKLYNCPEILFLLIFAYPLLSYISNPAPCCPLTS